MPQIELFVIYAVMALVLVFRPVGPVHPRAAEEDLTWVDRTLLSGAPRCSSLAARGGRRCRDWVMSLATIAFAKALVVLGLVILWRAGLVLVRPGALLRVGAYAVALPAAGSGSRDAFLLLLLGGVVAGAAFLGLAFCSRATARSSSRC